MDCFSFQIYCYSALGCRLVWRRPPCLLRSFLLKTGALSLHYRPVCNCQCSGHWMGRNYHWSYSPIDSFIENGIRMLGNKQFQKKKRKERKKEKKSLRMSKTGGRKTKSRKVKESKKDKPKRSRPRYIIIKLSNIKEKFWKKKEKNLPTRLMLSVSGGQSIGVSASPSVPPMNTQDWSPLEWTGWFSLQSKELSRVFSNTTVQKHQFFRAQLSLQSNSHIYTWPLEKP